jgi:hypothetical protein
MEITALDDYTIKQLKLDRKWSFWNISDADDRGVREAIVDGEVVYLTSSNISISMINSLPSSSSTNPSNNAFNRLIAKTLRWIVEITTKETRLALHHIHVPQKDEWIFRVLCRPTTEDFTAL